MNHVPYRYYSLVYEHFKDSKKADAWFMTKNPHLGMSSPFDLIDNGRGDKVLRFIESSLSENKITDHDKLQMAITALKNVRVLLEVKIENAKEVALSEIEEALEELGEFK